MKWLNKFPFLGPGIKPVVLNDLKYYFFKETGLLERKFVESHNTLISESAHPHKYYIYPMSCKIDD